MDILSYILGLLKGKSNAGVVIMDGDYTFTDDGEGNITITKEA